MGVKTIYGLTLPEEVGRDAFLKIGADAGLILKIPKTAPQTTKVHPSARYPNLLGGKVLSDINQLWTSDITYFKVGNNWCYLTFIMDVYSRRIIGYLAADNMRAINNIKALNMAIGLRNIADYDKKLIHHSDRGSQYISDAYIEILQQKNILISMCQNVLENAHIERVHRTIKEYLVYRNIKNLQQLKKWLDKSVYAYNYLRPHTSLDRMTPVGFENFVKELHLSEANLKSGNRKYFEIFTYHHKSDKKNPKQLSFEF